MSTVATENDLVGLWTVAAGFVVRLDDNVVRLPGRGSQVEIKHVTNINLRRMDAGLRAVGHAVAGDIRLGLGSQVSIAASSGSAAVRATES